MSETLEKSSISSKVENIVKSESGETKEVYEEEEDEITLDLSLHTDDCISDFVNTVIDLTNDTDDESNDNDISDLISQLIDLTGDNNDDVNHNKIGDIAGSVIDLTNDTNDNDINESTAPIKAENDDTTIDLTREDEVRSVIDLTTDAEGSEYDESDETQSSACSVVEVIPCTSEEHITAVGIFAIKKQLLAAKTRSTLVEKNRKKRVAVDLESVIVCDSVSNLIRKFANQDNITNQ